VIANKTKNKKFIFFLTLILDVFIVVFFVQGAGGKLEVNYPSIGGTTLNRSSTFPQYVAYIAKFSVWISLAIIFVVLAIAAIRYITSVGNPPVMKDAKNQIIAAFIGLGVVMASYLVLYTVNPELVRLKFGKVRVPQINYSSSSPVSQSALYNYKVVPVGQIVKEGIYGRDAMITASSTLNRLQRLIVKPKGIDIDAIVKGARSGAASFMPRCMSFCSKYMHWRFIPGGCENFCQRQAQDLIQCPNCRSLELMEEIDEKIAEVASECRCEDPNKKCCECQGSLCDSCCHSETGKCGPTIKGCDTQPVACPEAHCDTTTIKILTTLLGITEGNTEADLNELDKLRVHGAPDPKFYKPPLHITPRFENGPANVMQGLLQAKNLISNSNASNYNSILGLLESYGVKNVSITPLEFWMTPFWLKDKSDPLSFYVDANASDIHYVPPYHPVPPVGGKCSTNNGQVTNDKGIKMTLYCQGSNGWANLPIGAEACTGDTMASQGCTITSLSMIFNYLHISGNSNPGETLDTLKRNNCIIEDPNGCGSGDNGYMRWGKVRDYLESKGYKLISTSGSLDDLKTKYFGNGIPVLAYCTNFNNGHRHYIVLRGYEKGTMAKNKVYISDPGWGNTVITEKQYDDFSCSPQYVVKKP